MWIHIPTSRPHTTLFTMAFVGSTVTGVAGARAPTSKICSVRVRGGGSGAERGRCALARCIWGGAAGRSVVCHVVYAASCRGAAVAAVTGGAMGHWGSRYQKESFPPVLCRCTLPCTPCFVEDPLLTLFPLLVWVLICRRDALSCPAPFL